MQSTDLIVLALIAIVLVAAIMIWVAMRRRQTHTLRERFGDEYDRTLEEKGKRGPAEAALHEREQRVAKLDIRPLTPQERKTFTTEWQDVRSVFVDSPAEAVMHADRMVAQMMQTRGYPMADFNRRYEDLTVDHGEVARHYRAGREIADRHGRGEATTEDLRQAMKHYEALFNELVRDANDANVTYVETRHVEQV
jgi:hypothetical protein